MESLYKNIQLMLEFHSKAPFLVLHFSCYTLMTFLTMLYVILLSVLMIVLYFKCDQESDLWQQLELASELECDLRDTKLNWGSYIISIAEIASKKIGALIHSMRFLYPEVALYLYKSIRCPCMEYYCHVWAGAPDCYLELLDKLQKQ